MSQTKIKPKTKKSMDPKVAAVNLMVWNLNGGAVPDKTLRRLEGAVSSIIGDCKNARLMFDVVREV